MSEPTGFYGVWEEAWVACCRHHKIDSSNHDEREARRMAGRESFYNPRNVEARETYTGDLEDHHFVPGNGPCSICGREDPH